MKNEIAKVENSSRFMTVQEVIAGANLIQQVMHAVMKEKTHYGTVPGCGDKPTLLKPGAEKILSTFRISVIPIVEDLSEEDRRAYRVHAQGLSNGSVIGEGIGCCSSDEEKYKWRKAIGKEYDEAPEDRRRLKWRKGWNGGKDYQEQQVRTNPADLDNTILKMAKKRAMIDLCLTATAASDCFQQDVEDLPAEYVESQQPSEPSIQMPKVKTMPKKEEPEPLAPEAQIKALEKLGKSAGFEGDSYLDFLSDNGVTDPNKINRTQYKMIMTKFGEAIDAKKIA